MKTFFSVSKCVPALVFAGALAFSSCKKDNNLNNTDNPDPALSVEAAQNEATASSQFSDVFDITMGVQSSDAGEDIGLETNSDILFRTTGTTNTDSARCYTVTVVPKIAHQFPKTVTIDFGTGCVGKDGKMRSGKIVTIFTGPMKIPGSKTSTTFLNYNVDSFHVEGTYTIENSSTSNKQAWTVNVINGKITNTQTNKWVQWNATHEHKQIKGNGTPGYPSDNVYEITGNSQGSNSNGNSWTSEITEPVIKKFTCQWRVQGQITITRNAKRTAILDYGDGTCDNKATVTVNGVTRIITLP